MARRGRLLVLLAFALAGAGLAFAGAMPEGYATVGDVVAYAASCGRGDASAAACGDAAHGHGGRVTVKAAVVEGSLAKDGDLTRFVVTDGASELEVVWAKALPDHEIGGTIEGKTVVVAGSVENVDGRPVLLGETMQVGCASKYERLGKGGVGENPE